MSQNSNFQYENLLSTDDADCTDFKTKSAQSVDSAKVTTNPHPCHPRNSTGAGATRLAQKLCIQNKVYQRGFVCQIGNLSLRGKISYSFMERQAYGRTNRVISLCSAIHISPIGGRSFVFPQQPFRAS